MQQIVVALVAVLALAGVATAVVWALGLERPWLQPVAILRAIAQLGVLSVILLGVVSDGRWVAGFLVVMLGAAAWVVGRRLQWSVRDTLLVVPIIAIAAAVPVSIVFAIGAVEWGPRYLLALGGIVIGNCMTVCTLMGRGVRSALLADRDQVEGWLALGATPRRAAQLEVRQAGSTALIPTVDQTRTTGIVTLPGAFVGAVFAGASPVEAAVFQLVVLACILVAGALCVAAFSWRLGAPTTLATA